MTALRNHLLRARRLFVPVLALLAFGVITGWSGSRPQTTETGMTELAIRVVDSATGKGLPCRMTLVDAKGEPAALQSLPDQLLVVRPGVLYTPDGNARIRLAAGNYRLFVTRGFEYSLGQREILLTADQAKQVKIELRHEVPTPGLAACDTHTHTFTYSRHGDATTDERIVTIAGEGLDLPIATDHNILTDYAGPASTLKLQSYFTPVIGAEVTTPTGHFNVFPIAAGSSLPDHKLTDWTELMKAIRATPAVQVIVLNHARDKHSNFRPFDEANFNPVTGENRRGGLFGFNAMELVNSGALQSDLMRLYHDWFALLNYGYRVTAVGSSDSHEVGKYIVGQSRTYIYCNDSNPGAIDVEAACRSLVEGRALVSMGLLTEMKVNNRFVVGDLATGLPRQLQVSITVRGPSWVQADQVALYANGIKIRQEPIDTTIKSAEKARLTWQLSMPAHDVHLVAIATGPGELSPHWPLAPPYQPTSAVWQPRVVGSTNPIWIDADNDGKFTPAREYARQLVERHGTDPLKILPALAQYDEAVAAQAASLCYAQGQDIRQPEFIRHFDRAAIATRRGFRSYIGTIPAGVRRQ